MSYWDEIHLCQPGVQVDKQPRLLRPAIPFLKQKFMYRDNWLKPDHLELIMYLKELPF